MLVHFPIVFWTSAVAMDLSNKICGLQIFAMVGFWCSVAGLSMGTIAIFAGFLDYTAISDQHPAQSTAVGHMWVMGTAWLLFLTSVAVRGFVAQTSPSIWAIGTDMAGLIVMIFGAWLGARFEIGVVKV